MQRIGSFPEGMICVVFLGLRRKGEAGSPCQTQAQETVSPACIPSPPPPWLSTVLVHRAILAADHHWEYQRAEANFVHSPCLGHPLGWVKTWLSETALVPGVLSHIYFYQASQTFLFGVRDPEKHARMSCLSPFYCPLGHAPRKVVGDCQFQRGLGGIGFLRNTTPFLHPSRTDQGTAFPRSEYRLELEHPEWPFHRKHREYFLVLVL